MTREQELKLTRELGELLSKCSLLDKSEENKKRAERIKEIKIELGIYDKCKPRECRRPSRIRWK